MSVIDISSHVFPVGIVAMPLPALTATHQTLTLLVSNAGLRRCWRPLRPSLAHALTQYSKQYASNFRPVGRDLPALEALQQQNFNRSSNLSMAKKRSAPV
jgi:hypothetical protein